MGGEYKCAIVYGFEYMRKCVKLRGSDKFYIGSQGSNGCPIYYCIQLELNTVKDIQKEIDYLSAFTSNQEIIYEFDNFAAKYGKTPTWRLACVGDPHVDIMIEPKKEYLLGRFYEWTKDIEKLYNDDGSFTEDADDCIVCIFREEYMDFMIDKARKLKTFEEIYKMIENYYTE